MMPTRLLAACVTLLLCGTPIIARAGSGDPRLINGVVEWPAAVTNEPFVIVRGDDGVVYSVGIAAARREGAVTAGGRISVLGLEGRGPHEITAVGVGSGPSAEAAFAQLQGIREPAAIPPVVAAPPVPVIAPANVGAIPAVPKPTAPTAASMRPADAPSPKLPIDTRASAGAAAPVVPASTAAPAIATAQPVTFATAPMLVPSDEHRWVEIAGEVETLAGRTLVLKVDGGRVSVDLSSLRANLERIVTPGSLVKFYGVPVELRFKAMGFIDPDARPHTPRPN